MSCVILHVRLSFIRQTKLYCCGSNSHPHVLMMSNRDFSIFLYKYDLQLCLTQPKEGPANIITQYLTELCGGMLSTVIHR